MLSSTLMASASVGCARRALALRLGEALVVGVFTLLSLSSLWLCAAIATRGVEATPLLSWFFPTGVGLFMVLLATAIWALMIPSTVSFVRDEYRLFVAYVGQAGARGR